MRALSNRQAGRCETAKNKACRCRCGGQFHGKNRAGGEEPPEREFFEALPEDDPHHLCSPAEAKKRAKIRRQEGRAPQQTRLWEEL
jgi:hypothetical protein